MARTADHSLELINNSPLTVLMVLCLSTTGTCVVLSTTSVTSLDPAWQYMNTVRCSGAMPVKMLGDLQDGHHAGEVADVEPVGGHHGLDTKKLVGNFLHGPIVPRRGGDCPYTAMARALTNSL